MIERIFIFYLESKNAPPQKFILKTYRSLIPERFIYIYIYWENG